MFQFREIAISRWLDPANKSRDPVWHQKKQELHKRNIMASEKGIILITTLLFMQIFMLIGLFTLQNSFLIQMVAHEFQKKN